MFDYGEFMNDYLIKGFYRFSGEQVLRDFKLEDFGSIKTHERLFESDDPKERLVFYTKDRTDQLVQLGQDIVSTYLSDFDIDIAFNDMWSRVNENVHDWHSDFTGCPRGFNASINCYFDDSAQETGGQLQFVEARHIEDGVSTRLPASVYPNRFDIIILNQTRDYVHRVTPSSQQRRMMSYLCAFKDFNQSGTA